MGHRRVEHGQGLQQLGGGSLSGPVGLLPGLAVGGSLQRGVRAHRLVNFAHRGPTVGQPLRTNGETPVKRPPSALADALSIRTDGFAFVQPFLGPPSLDRGFFPGGQDRLKLVLGPLHPLFQLDPGLIKPGNGVALFQRGREALPQYLRHWK